MDGPTDRPMDRRMDRPSYRDAFRKKKPKKLTLQRTSWTLKWNVNPDFPPHSLSCLKASFTLGLTFVPRLAFLIATKYMRIWIRREIPMKQHEKDMMAWLAELRLYDWAGDSLIDGWNLFTAFTVAFSIKLVAVAASGNSKRVASLEAFDVVAVIDAEIIDCTTEQARIAVPPTR